MPLIRLPLVLWFWAGLSATCVGAMAKLDVSAVFTSGTDGYHTYRIPSLVVATNGTMLAFCEGRKNSRSDTGDIDMLVKRSSDGGSTWTMQQVIWSDGSNTCGNPTPVVDQRSGIILLLMCWNSGADKEDHINYQKSRDTRRVYLARSFDNGTTWAKPVEITSSVKKPDWGWYATGPGNGIQLTRGPHRGRLVIPANHSELNAGGETVTRSHVIFSDDGGKTWQIGGVQEEKTNESTVVELADGSLMQNMRSYHNQHRRAVAISQDSGATWSPVKLDPTLVEPVCQASLLRFGWPGGASRNRILFSNPASTKRQNLTVRLSYDEGSTWPVSKTIFPGPAAYSCLAVLPDKTIGCLFECGKTNSSETISLTRFSIDWLEASSPAQ